MFSKVIKVSSRLTNAPAVKTKPKDRGKKNKGRRAAKIPTGKTIFQSRDRAENNTKRKLDKAIKADKIISKIKVLMDKEKMKS